MRRYLYRAFGVCLESRLRLPGLIPISSWQTHGARRVVFRRRNFREPPPSANWFYTPSWAYWVDPTRGLIFTRTASSDLFRLHVKQQIIDWKPRGSHDSLSFMRISLLSRMLELLLAQRTPLLLLHACAVVAPQGGVAFLGPSHVGKSTLSAAFLSRGFPLLNDDVAVIQPCREKLLLQPGFPTIRLWPDSADHFQGLRREPPSTGPVAAKSEFTLGPRASWSPQRGGVPLRALYFLSRDQGKSVRVQPMAGLDAWMGLTRNTCHLIVHSRQRWRQSFELTRDVLRKVPFRRLIFPSGFSHLPRVCEVALQDLENP